MMWQSMIYFRPFYNISPPKVFRGDSCQGPRGLKQEYWLSPCEISCLIVLVGISSDQVEMPIIVHGPFRTSIDILPGPLKFVILSGSFLVALGNLNETTSDYTLLRV